MSLHFLKFSFVLTLLVFFVSCQEVGDDEGEFAPGPPLMDIRVNGQTDPAALTAAVGDTLFISAKAAAEAGIKSLISFTTIGESQTILHQAAVDSAANQVSIDSIQFVFDYTLSGKDVSFLVIVTDQLDQKDSAEFIVHVDVSAVTILEGVQLGSYGHASIGNLYSVVSDTAYFPNNVKTNIPNQERVDIIVSFNSDSKFTLSSPDDPDTPTIWNQAVNFSFPFQTVNSTRFGILGNAFDYDGIFTAAQLENAFPANELTKLSRLTAGQFIAIKLDESHGGKIGVMKIIEVTGNTSANRSVIFDLKIQK